MKVSESAPASHWHGTACAQRTAAARCCVIVDCGAAKLVLPASTAEQLGVPTMGEATVRYADQRTSTRPVVEEVRLELLGRHRTFSAIVEPNRTTALIRAIVLEDLDFLVDCTKQQLTPRDPNRIVSEIEDAGFRVTDAYPIAVFS